MNFTLTLLRLGEENHLFKLWQKILKRVFGLEDMRVSSALYNHSQYTFSYHVLLSHRIGISPEVVYSVNSTPAINEVSLPDLYMAQFKDIWIRGRSDCLFDFKKKLLWNDFGYTMDENVFSIQSPSVFGMKHHVALVRAGYEKSKNVLEKGVMLAADFSSNYYHVLYEILPRLQEVLYEQSIPKDVPLLIDNCIRCVPQLEDAFNLINSSERNIVWLEENVYYCVKDLYYISSVNRIPPQVLKGSLVRYEDFGFDVHSLSVLRDRFLEEASKNHAIKKQTPMKRIFISREGHQNRSCNEDELFDVAKQYGFQKLSPEKYSFLEQISLFHQAEIIVGATGAAFSNLLFTEKGSKAICFVNAISESSIFTASAFVAGCQLVYLAGIANGKNNTAYAIHADFNIIPEHFHVLLNEMCDY